MYSIDWQADIIMIFPVVFSIFILFLLPDFNFTIDLKQFSFYGMQLVIFDVFMVRDCHHCYDFYFYLFVFIYGSTYLFPFYLCTGVEKLFWVMSINLLQL